MLGGADNEEGCFSTAVLLPEFAGFRGDGVTPSYNSSHVPYVFPRPYSVGPYIAASSRFRWTP